MRRIVSISLTVFVSGLVFLAGFGLGLNHVYPELMRAWNDNIELRQAAMKTEEASK